MTAELVRGQNHPVPHDRVEIRVSAGTPVLALASLADEEGRLAGPGALARPGGPAPAWLRLPQEAADRHTLAVDLEAVAAEVHRIGLLLVLPPGGPLSFASVPAPHAAVAPPDGPEFAGFTLTGLGAETAVVALELYRRQGAWKVRAVGQGYAEGLGALLTDGGLPAPQAAELAAAVLRGPEGAAGADRTLAALPPRAQGAPQSDRQAAPAPAAAPEPPDPVPVSGAPYPGTPGPAPSVPGDTAAAQGPPTID
ncbi:hypothetical protein EF912_30720, partial [Streptomyces sp. WAC07061]|uniref:TerD family protein n=1 Tax=Streptomyces sp. WAC07061 TaxID=2487410 RepID=UPI000FA932FD